ncbi:carbohydrate ABC transporter permease [Halapricum hydrolyticum]|uniref:Sugar ABC transporter permease n=1 Tax=Halapricum hydrolyticum TaxID=2979991 RepID=A0AAE3LF02_9EURY|nr:sugar ABC transporter permease [Halapricum hydrolyticum]MCU4717871.1 sugar ABC transporter permease [Halapricum hydrolyticum]MCU4727036.1 sugar ABC transporter permease [Halapricum hydrolyticum]
MESSQDAVAGAGTGEHAVEDRRARLRRFWKSDFVRSAPYWGIPLLLMGLAVYGGIIWNILISLTDYQGFLERPDYGNLDLEMYRQALSDSAVHLTARNTFVLLVAFTSVSLVLGLFLAVLLDRDIREKSKVQTIYLLPMALSFVVTAQFWLWMYNYNDGLVNTVIGLFGLGPYNWIGNPSLVLGAVIFALIWQFSGYTMVVFLAGLQSISNDQFEAARVDGASIFKTYWRVIIPQLKSSSVSAAVVLMIFALKIFTFLYAMFGTYRPPKGTDVLATLMVREAFQLQKWAYSASIATILLAMSLLVIAPYLYYQYREGAL